MTTHARTTMAADHAEVRPLRRARALARIVVSPAFLVTFLAAAGGALVILGSSLPWLSLYAGLEPIRGTDGLNGRVAAGLGGLVVIAALVHGLRGGAGIRWALGGLGFALVGFCSWLGIQLLQTAEALSADPLLVSRLEPGLGVALVGGALVFATMFVPSRTMARLDVTPVPAPLSMVHILLAAVLLLAGVIHLALAPEHLAMSTLLGIGFVGTGIGQVAVGLMVLRSRSTLALRLALALSVFSLAALAAAVTVGLPVLGHGQSMGLLGPVEALDDVAALTGLAEAVAAVVAFRHLRRRARDEPLAETSPQRPLRPSPKELPAA